MSVSASGEIPASRASYTAELPRGWAGDKRQESPVGVWGVSFDSQKVLGSIPTTMSNVFLYPVGILEQDVHDGYYSTSKYIRCFG